MTIGHCNLTFLLVVLLGSCSAQCCSFREDCTTIEMAKYTQLEKLYSMRGRPVQFDHSVIFTTCVMRANRIFWMDRDGTGIPFKLNQTYPRDGGEANIYMIDSHGRIDFKLRCEVRPLCRTVQKRRRGLLCSHSHCFRLHKRLFIPQLS